MTDAFVRLDSSWRFTYLNPQTEKILHQSPDALLGRVIWNAFPETASRMDDALQHASDRQIPAHFEIHDDEGVGRILDFRVVPVADGLSIYFRDVTSERPRDNPLTIIPDAEPGPAASAIAPSPAPDANHVAPANGMPSAESLQLDALGCEQPPAPVALDLNQVVENASSALRALLPRNVTLRINSSRQPVIVYVEATQLDQVLTNLLVNSRDAIDDGGAITITITARENAPYAPTLSSGWLQVTDTGCGIATELIPRIFDPDVGAAAPGAGTGPGLATVHRIVSRSGGAITVDSAVGIGTTFTIAFPSAPTVSDDLHRRARAAGASPDPGPAIDPT
jgi:nitrogen fixation/metabolism regulation signal transduction histidine kinase